MVLKFLTPAGNDAERLYRSLANIFRFYNPDKFDTERELMQIYRRVKDNFGSYKLVKCGGDKVAYYYFHSDGDMMKLEDIYVMPRFRNRGIGTSILRRCISETEQPLCAELYYHNIYAMSLFKHNSFVLANRIDTRRCIMVHKNQSSGLYEMERHPIEMVFAGRKVFTY